MSEVIELEKKQLIKVESGFENGIKQSLIIEKIKKSDGSITKRLVHDENPDFHFFISKPENILEYDSTYIPKDHVKKINCKFKDLYRTIATVTNKKQEFEALMQNKRDNFRKLNKLHFNRNLFLSDMDLDDYQMRKWFDNNINNQAALPLSKAFIDIEVDLEDFDGFPVEEEAPCPINFISYCNSETKIMRVYVLYNQNNDSMNEFIERVGINDDNIISSKDGNEWALGVLKKYLVDEKRPQCTMKEFSVLFFETEEELLANYYKDIHKEKPDFIGAWNGYFDFKTMEMRCYRLNIEPTDIMCPKKFPVKKVNIKKDNFSNDTSDRAHTFDILGWSNYCDLLYYYAAIRKTRGKKESYKLGDILLEEIGESKFEFEGDIKDAVRINFESFLIYSMLDSFRLFQMEEKNKDIDLMYEMSQMSYTRISKVMRKTTSLRNLAAKVLFDEGYILSNNLNRFYEHNTEKFKGAFVASPLLMGNYGILFNGERSNNIFENVIDEDLASLYPHIILAFNLDAQTLIGRIMCMSNEEINERFGEIMATGNIIEMANKFLNLPTIEDILEVYEQLEVEA